MSNVFGKCAWLENALRQSDAISNGVFDVNTPETQWHIEAAQNVFSDRIKPKWPILSQSVARPTVYGLLCQGYILQNEFYMIR